MKENWWNIQRKKIYTSFWPKITEKRKLRTEKSLLLVFSQLLNGFNFPINFDSFPWKQLYYLNLKLSSNKTQGLKLRQVSDSKINPLISPVKSRGTWSDKTYYYNIWNSVERGYIPNFICIAPIMTELYTVNVKLTH